jgi:Family of unknown function (DUF6452)
MPVWFKTLATYLRNKTFSSTIFAQKYVLTRILLFALLLLFGASCFNEPDCIVTATTSIKIDFKQTTTNKTTLLKSIVDSTVIFSSVYVYGIDTGAYIQNKKSSSVTLPINPEKKSMKYVFNIQSTTGAITRKDSLEFSFDSESRVISQKCGAYTYFLNLKVTDTNLESTKYKLTNNRLLKNTTNVQVFF